MVWLVSGGAVFVVGLLFEHFGKIPASRAICLTIYAFCYLLFGHGVLLRMVRNLFRGKVFDENFLMGIATIGAISIGYYSEAVGIMLFYQIGEFFQETAVAKSRKRIGDLMDIRPDHANLIRGNEVSRVPPEAVHVGDLFLVKPGEKIPLDGTVVEGQALLDTSALTGESMPRQAGIGDAVLSGCINRNGVLTIRATQVAGESTAAKILDLVENAAGRKAPTEAFITKFARFYTPAVVIAAAVLAVLPPLILGGGWAVWLGRALIFLVVSCPCALVVSIPLGFFGGLGGASKRGILVKGGNYLEALANIDLVVFDKTGTLTRGVFKVVNMQVAEGCDRERLLGLAAYAESFSNHPIALSILKEYGKPPIKDIHGEYEEMAGYGVRATLEGSSILAGNEKLMEKMGIAYAVPETVGTNVHVAKDGVYAGCLTIADEIKPGSRALVPALKELGVRKTVMLTGDLPRIAADIGRELELDEVHAGLLPRQKVEKVEELARQKLPRKTLAFVGDGINDAPVLALADVGVAMGGLGSDAAIEAADIVLMTDEPEKLVEAVRIARFTRHVVWQNIALALGIKFLFLFLATLGVSTLWEAVFADVGVSLLAVLNSMRVVFRLPA